MNFRSLRAIPVKKKLVIPVKPVLLVGCTVIVSDGDSLKFCGRKIFAKKKRKNFKILQTVFAAIQRPHPFKNFRG